MWMKFATAKYHWYIAEHNVEREDEIRDSILGFHAITGYDTVSQFSGISKKAVWKVFIEASQMLSQ